MSEHNNQKPAYDENLFLTFLPSFAFLCLAFVAMVISVVQIKPSKDPFPPPSLTAEESLALITPPAASNKGSDGAATPSGPAGGHEGLALISKSDCVACHKDTVKVLGPAYADIAAKYQGDKDAIKKLVEKVKLGGKGNWGEIPMSPHATMKDEEIKLMIEYILTLKGGKAPEASPKEAVKEAPKETVTDDVHAEGFALIQKSDCIACHKNDVKLLGPSYKEISAKYKDDKEALKKLCEKVKVGGKGIWGEMLMSDHKYMKDEEIEKMVKAILSLK